MSTPVPPQPSGYPPAPPPRSGGALKIVLIVIAVVVGLGVIGVGVAGYIGYRAVHNGAISVGDNTVTSADLGVDPYPNATPVEHGTVRMKLAGHEMVTATYTTSDAPEAVVNFFKSRLGDSAIVNVTDRGTSLQTVENSSRGHLVITVTPNTNGTTGIAIVHEQNAGS